MPQEELAQLTITVIDQLIADCRYVNCLRRNDDKYLLQLSIIIVLIIITRVITVLRLIVRDFAVSLSSAVVSHSQPAVLQVASRRLLVLAHLKNFYFSHAVFIITRTVQPVATCRQSPYVHKPAIVKLLLLIYSFQFRSAFRATTTPSQPRRLPLPTRLASPTHS